MEPDAHWPDPPLGNKEIKEEEWSET